MSFEPVLPSVPRAEQIARTPWRCRAGRLARLGVRAPLAVLLFAIAQGSAAAEEEGPVANVLEFRTFTSNDKGVVRCGLFPRNGWLKKPLRQAVGKIKGGSAICAFQRVPAGTFGASAFHDENSNGKLDTNFIGLPTEEYCASRNARGTFGPPSFDDAKFEYRGGASRIEARMK